MSEARGIQFIFPDEQKIATYLREVKSPEYQAYFKPFDVEVNESEAYRYIVIFMFPVSFIEHPQYEEFLKMVTFVAWKHGGDNVTTAPDGSRDFMGDQGGTGFADDEPSREAGKKPWEKFASWETKETSDESPAEKIEFKFSIEKKLIIEMALSFQREDFIAKGGKIETRTEGKVFIVKFEPSEDEIENKSLLAVLNGLKTRFNEEEKQR